MMGTLLSLLLGIGVEVISVVGVIGALLISSRQNDLTSRAIRAQSFVQLLQLETEAQFQDGIRAITDLREYHNYKEFETEVPDEKKELIYRAVVFLNFMAVLGEERYIQIQDAWNVYFWSYRLCYEKLLPWWLAEQRVHQPNVFPSFERACNVIWQVTDKQIRSFDERVGLKYLALYRQTSLLPKGKLSQVLRQQIQPRVTINDRSQVDPPSARTGS